MLAYVLISMLGTYGVQSCQPELVDNVTSYISVGYDRQATKEIYVDTLSVLMMGKLKFRSLVEPGCNGRRDVNVTIEIRKSGSEEWEEKVENIKITSKQNDLIRTLDPCSKYEVRVTIVPLKGNYEKRSLPLFSVGPYNELDKAEIKIAKA